MMNPSTRQRELVNEISTTVFTLWWQHSQNDTVNAIPDLTRALPALAQVNGEINGTPLFDHLASLLRDETSDVRQAAVEAVRG